MFRNDLIEERSAPAEVYEFAGFRMDIGERVLARSDSGERIAVPDKAFDILTLLIRNAGKLVTKDDLLSRVWTDAFVEENNLNKAIHAIRRALGEGKGEQKFIETVKKHGYRFVADVRPLDPPAVKPRISDHSLQRPTETNIREFPAALHADHRRSSAALTAPRLDPETGNDPTEPPPCAPSPGPVVPRRRFGLIAASALLIVFAVGGSLAYRSGLIFRREGLSAGPVDSSTVRLAVLPLKPVSSDGSSPGLELAIVDAMILKLNGSNDFQVSNLDAVRKFAEAGIDPVESGRELAVDYVLASNYQTADGKMRVTCQLVNVGTGATEQTFKSESATNDFFAMQDTVANDIGNAVLGRFGKPASTFASDRGTEIDEAANLYYEAFYLVDKNTREDSAKAADLLGQAVLLDPNYSQAWALRAQAYCQFAHRGGGEPDRVFTIAEPMLDKALMLDRDNATALLVKGIIDRDYHWRFDDSYRDFRRAIELDPNGWFAHRELAVLYHHDGRFDEAVQEEKKALEINPTNVANRWLLGVFQIAAGHRDEGVAQLQRVMEMDPSFWSSYDTLWQLYSREGDGRNAYANFLKVKELMSTKPEHMARLKNAYTKGGWPAVLRAEYDLLKIEDPKDGYSGSKYYIAGLAAMNGDRDAAFEYLDQARRYRLIGVSWLKVDHRLDPLRDDPRFNDFLHRTGLETQ